jgi:hypothetical protein
MPRGDNWYAVWTDEYGVRLDDTGDPARRVTSFGAMDAARAADIAQSRRYGAEMPLLRSTNLERAQELVTLGALDQLRASDLNASAAAYRRLVSKPWTVFVLAEPFFSLATITNYLIPVLVAFILALVGASFLARV